MNWKKKYAAAIIAGVTAALIPQGYVYFTEHDYSPTYIWLPAIIVLTISFVYAVGVRVKNQNKT